MKCCKNIMQGNAWRCCWFTHLPRLLWTFLEGLLHPSVLLAAGMGRHQQSPSWPWRHRGLVSGPCQCFLIRSLSFFKKTFGLTWCREGDGWMCVRTCMELGCWWRYVEPVDTVRWVVARQIVREYGECGVLPWNTSFIRECVDQQKIG